MGTGAEFAKKLGTLGAVLVLILGIAATAAMFAARGKPVEGYQPPRDSAYYAEHLEELAEELETNLFPKLEAENAAAEVADGKVLVTAPAGEMETVKRALWRYYDGELFRFQTT